MSLFSLSDYNDALLERNSRGEELPFLSASNMLSAVFLEDPQPRWIKSIDGRMLAANPAFQRVYGIKIKDYMKSDDSSIWGEEIAKEFDQTDHVVVKNAATIRLIVSVDGTDLLVTKYPIFNADREVVAIAGVTLNHWGGEFNGR